MLRTSRWMARRRAQIVVRFEALEARSLATESLGILTAGIGTAAAVSAARGDAGGQSQRSRHDASYAPSVAVRRTSHVDVSAGRAASAGAGAATASPTTGWLVPNSSISTAMIVPTANRVAISQPTPAATSNGSSGGSIGSSHGGSGSTVAFAALGDTNSPAPGSTAGSTPSPATTAPALFILPTQNDVPLATAAQPVAAAQPAATSNGTTATPSLTMATAGTSATAALPFYALDVNAGQVIYPGSTQLATLGGNVELRAQIKGTSGATFSWNTSGLTNATAITGASTADLKFQWNTSNSTSTTNSVTLSVTSGGSTTSQTYTFQVPTGSGATAGTGTVTWPTVISPDAESSSAPTMAVQDGSIDAVSGSFDTSIAMPSYNPNVPAVTLAYDSVTANPLPILDVHHTLDPTQAVPSQVSAQLTFNGSAGTTVSTNTSQMVPGDVQQLALQANAAGLATGRYAYSVAIGDIRSTTTTTTSTGSTDIVNYASSAIGAGWSVAGLEKIVPAAGGVMLDLGGGGKSLWFATGSGSTYTSPAGDFSTLVANSGGTYTRTMPNGFVYQFNNSGQETSALNTNGIGDNFAYNSNGSLNTITDNYNNVTTFAYTNGLLSSITDPTNRVTSFTHSGANLASVTLPDSSAWSYGYSSGGQLASAKDPNGNNFAISYDAAGRAIGVTNPDSTTESFTHAQEIGLVAAGSGTASSPAAPFLLAETTSTMTDQVGDVTSLLPDWQGLGLTDVTVDPMGYISTDLRSNNGLATVAVDPLNRITQDSYDSKADVTGTVYPDGTTSSANYNSLAEPLTVTNRLGYSVTYGYDSTGDKTSYTDQLGKAESWTWSGGQITSYTGPSTPAAPAPSGGGGGGSPGGPTPAGAKGNAAVQQTTDDEVQNNSYNTQGQQTSSNYNGSQTTGYTFTAAGLKATETLPNGGQESWTYDKMNRPLTFKDANGNTTTYAYDPNGNRTSVTTPLGDKTTTAFNTMNLPTTVTDPRGGVATTAYDQAGRTISFTDSDNNNTSYTLNANGWITATTDAFGNTATQTLDADGETTSKVDRDGRQTNYTYNPMGQVLTETWLSGTGSALDTFTSTYDNGGELLTLKDNSTALTYTYDKDGNIASVSTAGTTGLPSVTLSYTYAGEHIITGLTDNLSSVGSISYYYDTTERLSEIASTYGGTAGPQETFSYDQDNNLTGESRTVGGSGTAITSTLGYNTDDQLTSISHQVSGGSTLDSYAYGYNADNDLTSDQTAEGTATDTYDADDELTGTSGDRSESYSYDVNGNRTMSGYTTGTNNQLTAAPGYTYTYDKEQNLISKTQTSTGNVWTYTWDYRDRLTGVVEKNSSGTVLMQGTYTYDGMNRRIIASETVSGTTTTTATVYNGSNPYADFNGSGTLLTRYLTGLATDQYLARISASGTAAWYLTDHEGTIHDIASSSGSVLDHISYDNYGNVLSESSPSNGDRFKFDGMAWDSAISEYYDNARYYDPIVGRFSSQDPIAFKAQDGNLFRFVNDAPTDGIDPSGDYIIWIILGLGFTFGLVGCSPPASPPPVVPIPPTTPPPITRSVEATDLYNKGRAMWDRQNPTIPDLPVTPTAPTRRPDINPLPPERKKEILDFIFDQ